jgi:hypothetical protein
MVTRVAALLTLVLAACAHVAPTPDASSENPLIGTWQLVGVVAIRPNGEATVSKWGKNPSGFIHYTRDGHMAAQIMGDPRPMVRDPARPMPEESQAILESYVAYAGTYTYDPATKVVVHHVQMSIVSTEIGQGRPRKVELDGDQVTLTASPYTLRGETVFNKLTWRRLR